LPISFSRIRIAGFKSFAEPAVVDIRPGLTGIVGPNGCGKSNVVEALRWAMGENSAKSMRGTEMDDVIFAGTAARPARNLAEVTLLLDEAMGLLPPPHHEAGEIEVTRRIERGNGSNYRVNGKEARARDVQTMFADLATGAHSSGMVSQGRVASIVNAKPDERRMILEEAAGITGLHARRHEAELKLRAAEANLARAEDLRGQLEVQLESLKRQARQANRYRNISGLIRQAEAELLSVQRARAEAARAAARAALHDAQARVTDATAVATAAGADAAAKAADLPALRAAEGEARTALERHRLGLEQITAEEARAREALAAAEERLRQIARDLAHAEQLQRDAAASLDRLAHEEARLDAEDAQHPPRFAAAEAAVIEAADAVRETEAQANRATERAADIAARHRALVDAVSQAEQRVRRLTEQAARLAEEQARVRTQLVDPERLAAATTEASTAEARAVAARAAQDAAEQARAVALAEAERRRAGAREEAMRLRAAAQAEAVALRAAAQAEASRLRATAQVEAEQARAAAASRLAAAREAAATAETARTRLAAEVQALTEILAVKDGEAWPRLVDQLTVPAGLEAALGAALGEELDSAADINAARHWRELPALDPAPALPAGVTPFADLVQGPAVLARALSQIGLADEGAELQAALAPGQMIVSRAGAVWRWDGYTIRPGTPTAAAVRLQQRNRLAGLAERLTAVAAEADAATAARRDAEENDRTVRASAEQAERAARAAAEEMERGAQGSAQAAERTAQAAAETVEREAREAAATAEREANAADQLARAARREAEQTLERARTLASQLAAQAGTATARLAGLDEQAGRIAAELAEAQGAKATVDAALTELPDPAAERAAMETARGALAHARSQETAARTERDTLARAASGRAFRRRAIEAERTSWTERSVDASGRVTDLSARHQAATAEQRALSGAPEEIAARHAVALDALESAEATHRRTTDALTSAETAALLADRAARSAEATLATAREAVVRIEGEGVQAEQAWGTVAERILERLGVDAVLPDPPADIGPETEDKLRKRHERLLREREEMGPVNLRAEVEAEEITTQIDTIVREREELTTAIAKLRGSIGSLNREGRERLSAVFEQVDKHFQALFARMFGGGRAHLSLVGSDDPLLAGLEIYAQPPGKKLATLSLLSGGEQALTALSLIFAVFRCNPAPVCVLDEVDAPLDDANVERFCMLLEDMVKETGTRFLVVTHHQLTMARMDRLYGVTMQERGVSRLLSVDLAVAAGMVEAPQVVAA